MFTFQTDRTYSPIAGNRYNANASDFIDFLFGFGYNPYDDYESDSEYPHYMDEGLSSDDGDESYDRNDYYNYYIYILMKSRTMTMKPAARVVTKKANKVLKKNPN